MRASAGKGVENSQIGKGKGKKEKVPTEVKPQRTPRAKEEEAEKMRRKTHGRRND
jgi:hypothetical protein